jgi:hypothetical protein
MRIEDFPLSWRWTRTSHAKLPSDVLGKLVPIEPHHANHLYDLAVSTFQTPIADERRFSSVDDERARTWLQALPVPPEAGVTIVWNRELGVSLPWSIFANWWSDFCYPSSDDAFIFLPNESGLLSYEHYEEFCYRPAAA